MKKVEKQRCPECGRRIESNNPYARYCSGKCRTRAWRARKNAARDEHVTLFLGDHARAEMGKVLSQYLKPRQVDADRWRALQQGRVRIVEAAELRLLAWIAPELPRAIRLAGMIPAETEYGRLKNYI
jgi:endogenous inhibitor of DNA gyrase (YacG/DUF329 family)